MIVTATRLNIRSGPGTQYMVLGQRARDEKVEVQETTGDWSRIAPCGWVASMFLSPPLFLAVPTGLQGIRTTFGEPGAPAASAGRVALPEPLKLGWSEARVTRVACHALIEREFTAVFETIHARGLWYLLKSFDGIYNDRTARGSAKKSTHAWGIAVDLNAATNRMGTAGDMDSRVVSIFEQAGFQWGGRWPGASRDPMHFQYATGY